MDTFTNHVTPTISVTSANSEDPALGSLWHEHKILAPALRKQGSKKDVALLIHLMLVMYDLGLYYPSPP